MKMEHAPRLALRVREVAIHWDDVPREFYLRDIPTYFNPSISRGLTYSVRILRARPESSNP